MNKLIVPIIVFVFLSCNDYKNQGIPDDVVQVLKKAGSNRKELLKVINHYKGDSLKLQATYFLIGNMDDKFTIECEDIARYDPIFNILDSFRRIKPLLPGYLPSIQNKWDSLVQLNGPPSFQNARAVPDYQVIKAGYLIENIDLAFRIRSESQWGKNIGLENFFEYILPYRFRHEPLERWRSDFLEKYKAKLDSVSTDSCFHFALKVNKILPAVTWFPIMMSYPYDISYSKMEKVMVGACPHMVIYYAARMRAAGIPTGIDYTPLLGNSSAGHKWNVLFTENGKAAPFKLFLAQRQAPAKIFRETFGRQEVKFPGAGQDVPESLLNNHRIDVTREYIKAYDIKVKLGLHPVPEKRYAVLCTFNNKDWVAQDAGRIQNGTASFGNMGSGIVYLPMYYNNGMLYPAGAPFLLQEDGSLAYMEASREKKQDMVLLRKFHYCTISSVLYRDQMVGGCFQGANKADFSDPVRLFTIKERPERIVAADIDNHQKFRYVRYIGPVSEYNRTNVAELWFYGGKSGADTLPLKGKVIGFPEVPASAGTSYQNVFDGNFILVGDTYELCYWDNGDWVSMGKQVAKDQYLRYENVPSGGLYLLHNLTRGKEERIFTYEEGKQVFW